MDWTDTLEKLGYLALILGITFGIAFLVLGNFQSSLTVNSLAYNVTGYVIQAFSSPIKQYLGLIVLVIFLIILFIIAVRGIREAKRK